MKGQIICHIGPPKTATTSVQVALREIERDDFLFLGTIQPRNLNIGSLSQRLHDFCSKKCKHSEENKDGLSQEIEESVNIGKTICISEEMFLAGQDSASIQRKINKLKSVIGDIPCGIVITLRDPKFALPSYYQEIFNSLPVRLQLSFSAFCRDEIVTCYDYEKILRILYNAGFNDIKLIDFDTLSSGYLDLGEFIGKDDFAGTMVKIGKHNSGSIGNALTARKMPGVSLKSLGNSRFVRTSINNLGMRRWPGYRHCVTLFDRIVLRRAKLDTLIVPSDVLNRLGAGYTRVKRQARAGDV